MELRVTVTQEAKRKLRARCWSRSGISTIATIDSCCTRMENSGWSGEQALGLNLHYGSSLTAQSSSQREWKDVGWTSMLSLRRGVPQQDAQTRTSFFGPNAINIEARSAFQILIDEVLHPFYVFQIFSIILWTFDDYYCQS